MGISTPWKCGALWKVAVTARLLLWAEERRHQNYLRFFQSCDTTVTSCNLCNYYFEIKSDAIFPYWALCFESEVQPYKGYYKAFAFLQSSNRGLVRWRPHADFCTQAVVKTGLQVYWYGYLQLPAWKERVPIYCSLSCFLSAESAGTLVYAADEYRAILITAAG